MKINIKIVNSNYKIIMFQFEKISDFDFNRIYESTSVRTFGLSLDDFDEDDDMPIVH